MNGHERRRYHALLPVTNGYSHRETADILLVDEETIGRWVKRYQAQGLDGLKNDPRWGGEHGQRRLQADELDQLSKLLEQEAMPGTEVAADGPLKRFACWLKNDSTFATAAAGLPAPSQILLNVLFYILMQSLG